MSIHWQSYLTEEHDLEQLIEHWQMVIDPALLEAKRLLILRLFKQQLTHHAKAHEDCFARQALSTACELARLGQIPLQSNVHGCGDCASCPH